MTDALSLAAKAQTTTASLSTTNAKSKTSGSQPPRSHPPRSTDSTPSQAQSEASSSQVQSSQSQSSIQVSLSAAARAQAEGNQAATPLQQGAEEAKSEADSFQAALDELQASFEKLLKTFGLSDEEAISGAKAGRAAVKEAAQTAQGASNQPDFRITTTQTLVVEAREVSFTLTRDGEDGTRTSVTASVQSVSISYQETTTVEAMWKESDPLVLDLDGNGLDLASGATADKRFDMDGDGTEEQTAWVTGADAFLAMDRNGDGAITSGQELFGDQHGAKDGFAELAKLDTNADGVINAQDKDWGSLLLLKSNGSTQSLEAGGVTQINLDAIVPMDTRIGNAGRLTGLSTFGRADGRTGSVGNVKMDIEV
jgi:hypothetical protein